MAKLNQNYLPENLQKLLVFPPSVELDPSIGDNESTFIYHFIRQYNLKKTLEIGFAWAKSGSYIMAASMSKHVAIDPFQKYYENGGLANIERLGLSDNLEFYRDYSHFVLPQLASKNRQFDFIFVDGGHLFENIFVDMYFSDLLLEPGGYLILHDTWLRSTCITAAYLRKNRKDYKSIKSNQKNMMIFQKNGKDQRDWWHFKEFYTFKSLLAYNFNKLLLSRSKKRVS